jgi:predicted RNA-binding Zn ribbon-like protein
VSQIQPGGREPAPGDLALVQDFVNTNDIEGRRDQFATPELMRAWLLERGLLGKRDRISTEDFVAATSVRECLRSLAGANNELPVEPAALQILDQTARRTLAVSFTPEGERLVPVGKGVDRTLGRLLAVVLTAMHDDTWSRMKQCRRDLCRWLFYDHSRNRSSNWCSMSVCGNKEKTRAYRRRRAPAMAPPRFQAP